MSKEIIMHMDTTELFDIKEKLLDEEFKLRTSKRKIKPENKMQKLLDLLSLIDFTENLMEAVGI